MKTVYNTLVSFLILKQCMYIVSCCTYQLQNNPKNLQNIQLQTHLRVLLIGRVFAFCQHAVPLNRIDIHVWFIRIKLITAVHFIFITDNL